MTATPAERLLLAIYGRDPDDEDSIAELRRHAAMCTRAGHTYCFPGFGPEETPPRQED